jgi:hypothetical protein
MVDTDGLVCYSVASDPKKPISNHCQHFPVYFDLIFGLFAVTRVRTHNGDHILSSQIDHLNGILPISIHLTPGR